MVVFQSVLVEKLVQVPWAYSITSGSADKAAEQSVGTKAVHLQLAFAEIYTATDS